MRNIYTIKFGHTVKLSYLCVRFTHRTQMEYHGFKTSF